jgi:cytochrome c553
MGKRILSIGLLCLSLSACGNESEVQRGAALYAEHCALCHGRDLRGGGGAGVEGLSRTPADLTVLSRNAGGEFPRGAVLAILDNYAKGEQRGRMMRPFSHLTSDDLSRVKTAEGRVRVSTPQAALLAYLESVQRP